MLHHNRWVFHSLHRKETYVCVPFAFCSTAMQESSLNPYHFPSGPSLPASGRIPHSPGCPTHIPHHLLTLYHLATHFLLQHHWISKPKWSIGLIPLCYHFSHPPKHVTQKNQVLDAGHKVQRCSVSLVVSLGIHEAYWIVECEFKPLKSCIFDSSMTDPVCSPFQEHTCLSERSWMHIFWYF